MNVHVGVHRSIRLCASPLPDPIDLTGEEDALQKALALSIQEMQRQSGGGGISIEEQELSRCSVRPSSGLPVQRLCFHLLPPPSLLAFLLLPHSLPSSFPRSSSPPLPPSPPPSSSSSPLAPPLQGSGGQFSRQPSKHGSARNAHGVCGPPQSV